MNRAYFLPFLPFIIVGCTYSVDTWVSNEDEPQITDLRTEEYWNGLGYFDGPCGWVKQETVSTLPSPNSNGFVKGTDVVVEFATNNGILREISVPANSLPVGADESHIYTNDGLKISENGSLSIASLKPTFSTLIECPVTMVEYFGRSDYLTCSEFKISDYKTRLFAYQTPCT